MEFNRSPRIQETVEHKDIDIPAPKALPSKPKVSWVTLGLPLVGTMLAVGLMVAFLGSTSGLSMLLFLPMVIASAVASVITSIQGKKEYSQQVVEENAAYTAVLKRKRGELEIITEDQKRILEFNDPDLTVCVQWAKDKYYRLGERRPGDTDFLTFRIGTGTRKADINIKIPDENGRDKLYLEHYKVADALKSDFSKLPAAPITTSLLTSGCIGIAGSREKGRDLTRAAIMHLVTHHWPSEMNLAVFCNSISVADEWKWVSNLPHRTSLFKTTAVVNTPDQSEHLKALEKEIHFRQAFLYHEETMKKERGQAPLLPALVCIFDHIDNLYDQAAFSLILKEGMKLGIYAIFLVNRFEDIPGECGATLDFQKNELIYKETGIRKTPVEHIAPCELTIPKAEEFAASLSGIDWLIPAEVTEPPEQLSLLDLFDVSDPDELKITDSWDGNYFCDYLCAPIGRFTPTSDLIFDLNESSKKRETHGPHGVIGGMTGSGKSELLRTIILSIALAHHPYDVNFALIDYKGGGAFKDLEGLPHVVGVTTDIENHANYAGRVIQALTGEINIRKQILGEAQNRSGLDRAHIDDYRHLDVKRPLPRLIIIFDEFAEFKDQHPEESRKLINIARQGRSLGVHLILCTQNPAAAIDEQVRQNSKFAISLSVNSPDDSRNLIGIPDAFGLPVGLAYIYVKSPQKFRVAYSGKKIKSGRYTGQSEAQAIVKKLNGVLTDLGLQRPPKVWPDPLPDRLYLPELLKGLDEIGITTAWNDHAWESSSSHSFGYLLGRYDDPAHQSQPMYQFGAPNANQNMLVFGSPRSGKSTLLLTLASGIACANTPAQAHIYCLDLGGQSPLYMLKDLPHIAREGGLISNNDPELINSLFSLLRTTMRKRKRLFQPKDAKTLDEYNLKCTDPSQRCPAIYLLIDGLTSHFAETMESFNDQLIEVILGGHSAGISVVITAPVAGDIQYKILSYITNRIILCPVEKNQVDSIIQGIPSNLLDMMLAHGFPPGRGILGGYPAMEVQTALPVLGMDDAEQNQYLTNLVTRMNKAWKSARPADVPAVPGYLTLDDLQQRIIKNSLVEKSDLPDTPIGIGRENKPLGFSLDKDGPAFLVTSSSPGQGKTDYLHSFILNLAKRYSPEELKIMLVDFHKHSLKDLAKLAHIPKGWFISRANQLEPTFNKLLNEINARNQKLETIYLQAPDEYSPAKFIQDNGYILIVVDDYIVYRIKGSPDAKQMLSNCLTLGEEAGVRIVIAGINTQLGYPSADEFLTKVTQSGCGLALGGFEGLETYYNSKVGTGQKTIDYPPGRGYLVSYGIGQLVQAATYCPEGADSQEIIKKLVTQINLHWKTHDRRITLA